MIILWFIQFILILFFLFFFLRKRTWGWAIGLLTVAILLFIEALRIQEMLPELGYGQYVLGGLLAAGTFIWASSLRPKKITKVVVEQSLTAENLYRSQMVDKLRVEDIQDILFDLHIDPKQIGEADRTTLIDYVLWSVDQRHLQNKLGEFLIRKDTDVSKEKLPALSQISEKTAPHLIREALNRYVTVAEMKSAAQATGVKIGEDAGKRPSTVIRDILWESRRVGKESFLLEKIRTEFTK